MAKPAATHSERRQLIWKRVHQELVKHAKPDSRSHYDFLSFTPDFRESSYAIARLAQLPCYQAATTILVTSDNSLEQLRLRALKDGKKVLVGTYRLRRGFVMLSPQRISDDNFELASLLDGMERPGIGRHLSLAQMKDEGIHVDLCVTGGLAFNMQGVIVWEGHGLFEVQWAVLHDMKVMAEQVPVVAVAHQCQVVDEADHGLERLLAEKPGEVQCDFIVTPERTIEVQGAVKPTTGVQFETLDPQALDNIPPLQELKGIRTMEKIMKDGGLGEEARQESNKTPTAEEQLGMNMVEKIMKGFKVGE
jgi:5-formyltetrahydrofolate cyclo-ligase